MFFCQLKKRAHLGYFPDQNEAVIAIQVIDRIQLVPGKRIPEIKFCRNRLNITFLRIRQHVTAGRLAAVSLIQQRDMNVVLA